MKIHSFLLLSCLSVVTFAVSAQQHRVLSLPRIEQLSSQRVLMVMQDSEGYLWYATEGGGLCRDDGRQITVFRSDAEHPDLLGSNDVASIVEAAGRYIIIGTFHGAYVLDKRDYSISHLTDVDDKRVDDIIVDHDGHWWLTANKKVYKYTADGQLQKTYDAGDKYIARLHEDKQGRLWASQWEGTLLQFDGEQFMEAPWTIDAQPTSIDDDDTTGNLLIGTIGMGVVRYNPHEHIIEPTEPSDSICMSRVTTDHQGRWLVADGRRNCYALETVNNGTIERHKAWFTGTVLNRFAADSIRTVYGLSARPTALAMNSTDEIWFSTGQDIRLMKHNKEEVILSNTKDVSAMTFAHDGTLWLATIFGSVMTYKDNEITTDDYASNEYGDAIVALETDSTGRIVIVSERYVRLYDPVRKTLRQQNIEDDGVYHIELQETQPGKHWSQPEEEVVERMPQWIFWLLAALVTLLIALVVHIWLLCRQRKIFLAAMTHLTMKSDDASSDAPSEEREAPADQNRLGLYSKSDELIVDEWLQKAIATVEEHMNDEHYSVEQLSADMCMSRMTFYRKIQAATGQKPTEFIRTIRLRRAAELLHEGRLTITEISYETGFSSVSYFSRCFRSMFGVPPTGYH